MHFAETLSEPSLHHVRRHDTWNATTPKAWRKAFGHGCAAGNAARLITCLTCRQAVTRCQFHSRFPARSRFCSRARRSKDFPEISYERAGERHLPNAVLDLKCVDIIRGKPNRNLYRDGNAVVGEDDPDQITARKDR